MGFLESKQSFWDQIDKIEKEVVIENENSFIFDNSIGFLGVKGGVGTSSLLANVALDVASKGKSVCIMDADVFKPSIIRMFDCASELEEEQGLQTVLKDDSCDIRDNLIKTKYDNVYILSRSLNDKIEDFLDFEEKDFKRVIDELKSVFDIVLIDIPLNFCLEFCIYPLKFVDRGFMVWEDNIECFQNTFDIKFFLKYAADIDTGKISNIIINKRRLSGLMDASAKGLIGVPFNTENISELKCRLFSEVPFIGEIQNYINEGRPYLKAGSKINGRFLSEIEKITRFILYLDEK